MDYQWYELGKQHYNTCHFTENTMGKRFSRLQHDYMLTSVAYFGGPIAITSDKTKILTLREDDPSIENICIYSNEGEIQNRVRLTNPFQNVVICLQFLQNEFLLALFQGGQQWLIDPYDGSFVKYKIKGLEEGEGIVEGKVFQNSFAIRTTKTRILFVRNVFQPSCLEFINCEKQLIQAQQHLYWRVFPPRQLITEKIQLHLAHPTIGIIQIIQNESKKYYFTDNSDKKLPKIKGIKYISQLSPNKKLIAYFCAEPIYKQNPMDQIPQNLKKKNTVSEKKKIPTSFNYKIVIGPSLYSETIQANKFRFLDLNVIKASQHLDQNQQPVNLVWCGNKALILHLKNGELLLQSLDGQCIKIQKNLNQKDTWCILKSEIDGVRIISKYDNKIIRPIPSAYVSTFQTFSQQPGALLYLAFEAYEDQAPLQDDQIRKDKKKLMAGVDQCLKSSRFQLQANTICKLMRAAIYGKAFLPPQMISSSSIHDLAKILRVVNHLRQKLRYITLEQFQAMSDDILLRILFRNRQHYLAFQIHNYLKKDNLFRIKIYTDWACCKVKNFDESDDDICAQIKSKLMGQTGISFTEIAHRAIQIRRNELAMKLLDSQASLAKKIPLLLWIGHRQPLQTCYKFYQKGINDAIQSYDMNLLFLCISNIINAQRLTDQEIYQMFVQHHQGTYALINYYRMFNSKQLVKFYGFLSQSESIIMEYIRKGLVDRSYQNMRKLFGTAAQQLKMYNSPHPHQWRKDTFKKLFEHFNQFIQHNPQIKMKDGKITHINLSKNFEVLMARGQADAVNDMKSIYKITDRRTIMTKIKTLIDLNKYQQLLTFVEKHQSKYKIPVQMLADLLMKKRQSIWAIKMIARMTSKQKDQQYLLLQRIGRIKQAIDLAHDRKDVQALEDIHETLVDASLIAYVNQKLSQFKKK